MSTDGLKPAVETPLLTASPEASASIQKAQREEITTEQREKTKRTLEQGLEEIVPTSIEHQTALYSYERGENNVVRLGDIADQELRQKVWQRLRHGKFKRFQELFCDPENYIVPSYSLKNGMVIFDPDSMNKMTLAWCLVNPHKLPDDLAENLLLQEFAKEDEGNPYQRLAKKSEPHVIANLKQIFEAARPIKQRNERLLAIQPEVGRVKGVHKEAQPIPDELVGSLLYTSQYNKGKGERGRKVQFFDDADGAYRKTIHEMTAYRNEMIQLTDLQMDIQSLIHKLNSDWRKDTPEEEKVALDEEALVFLAKAQTILEACTNEHKVDAREFLMSAEELKDARGIPNISRRLSKLVAAVNRIKARFPDMTRKNQYNLEDQMALQEIIFSNESTLRDFRVRLQRNAKVLGEKHLEIFSEKELSSKQRETQAMGIRKRLNLHSEELTKEPMLRPHRTYAKALQKGDDKLTHAIDERDRGTAQKEALRMHLIGKCQGTNVCCARIKETLAHESVLPIHRVEEFITRMKPYIENYQIFPDLFIPEFQEVFEQLVNVFTGIQAAITAYKQRDIGEEKLTEIIEETIDGLDCEELVRQLSLSSMISHSTSEP